MKQLLLGIAEQSEKISEGFLTRQGVSDTENIYGERQLEMDKWADSVLIDALAGFSMVASVASEERPEVVTLNEGGKYSVTLDPLDGSSLMGINLTVGTIVGIFEAADPIRPGKEMVGAMYILYGPLTVLTYSVGRGVHEFVKNREGDFVLQHENLRIGDKKIYSPGALRKKYLPAHSRYIEDLEDDGYKLRFSGSFVADVHQILHKGGVFTYPGFKGREQGKLRLLFEANPMGFIVKNAGGAVSNGLTDMHEIVPDSIDHRTPVYIGGKGEIGRIEKEMSGGENP